MLLSSLFALLSVLLLPFLSLSSAHTPLAPRRPSPRSYDTHAYYALELSPTSPPSAVAALAESLGAELVEPLGELAGHWVVRSPHAATPLHGISPAKRDHVVERYDHLRRSRSSSSATASHLRSLTPLTLRRRSKRHAAPPPSHPHSRRTLHTGLEMRADDSELLYAQNDLHLADPMLNQQWHLINTEMTEVELNVTGVWGSGVTGDGVKVVIVDDGLDLNSEDLKDNFFAEGSWDFNDHTELPLPRLSDDQHGTRCAGEIAAVPNDVCGVGVAYTSKVAGVRILSAPISDADEAAALNYAYQLNDIYSCSWGPPDDGKSMEAPEGIILKAMVNGVQEGRGGKGSLFVFAAGNGGGVDDQCNFDGYTNSIFSITVGAVDRKGLHPYYSELCSAMMMVAPSSGSGDHIHTTDVGENKCSHGHGGTSAAAPLAVGVFALALSVRPDLTWRDFQHLSVQTSVFFNPDDPDWEKTAAGRMFSYKYGYGRVNAGLFVDAAKEWKLVKPQAWYDSPAVYLPTVGPADSGEDVVRKKRQDDEDNPTATVPSPDGGDNENEDEGQTNPPPVVEPTGSFITEEGVVSSFDVTQEMLSDSNFERLEHVTVRVWIDHQRRGDVEVEIKSPNGVTSVLAKKRRFDDADTGYPGWKFMSLKHWDENPIGTWTITVRDTHNPDKTGRFVAWSLQLWGECIDASLAKNWAPAEEGAPDEEQTGSNPSATVSQKPKPTDHLPGDHGDASGEAHLPGLGTATPVPTSDADVTTGGEEGDVPAEDVDQGWFSGIETLGSSSTWIAGAGMIVVLLGAGLGAVFFFRARRRRRNLFGMANNGEGGRGAYQPVSGEAVPMGLLERGRRKLGGGGGAAGGGGTKELYDAFGDGPSDDDDDDSEEGERRGLVGREGLRYHDEFLGDDDEDERGAGVAGGGGEGEGGGGYRDEPEEGGEEGDKGKGKEGEGKGEESTEGSSGSWQDAAEEVRSS